KETEKPARAAFRLDFRGLRPLSWWGKSLPGRRLDDNAETRSPRVVSEVSRFDCGRSNGNGNASGSGPRRRTGCASCSHAFGVTATEGRRFRVFASRL